MVTGWSLVCLCDTRLVIQWEAQSLVGAQVAIPYMCIVWSDANCMTPQRILRWSLTLDFGYKLSSLIRLCRVIYGDCVTPNGSSTGQAWLCDKLTKSRYYVIVIWSVGDFVTLDISSSGEYSDIFLSNHLKNRPTQPTVWYGVPVDHSVVFGSVIFFQRLAAPSPSI